MVERGYMPPAGYARQLLKDLDMVHNLAKAVQAPTRLAVARGLAELDTFAVLKLHDKDPV